MKWLTFCYIFLFSTQALAVSLMTGLSGMATQWAKMATLIGGIYCTWATTMLALIVTLAKREAAGKPLVPINGNGGTEFTHKEETTTTTGTTQLPT